MEQLEVNRHRMLTPVFLWELFPKISVAGCFPKGQLQEFYPSLKTGYIGCRAQCKMLELCAKSMKHFRIAKAEH